MISKKKIRWRSMRTAPKAQGIVYVLGDDGKHYTGFYNKGTLLSKAPGWVSFVGWRRSLPKQKS